MSDPQIVDGVTELAKAGSGVRCEACGVSIARGTSYGIFTPSRKPRYRVCMECADAIADGRLKPSGFHGPEIACGPVEWISAAIVAAVILGMIAACIAMVLDARNVCFDEMHNIVVEQYHRIVEAQRGYRP